MWQYKLLHHYQLVPSLLWYNSFSQWCSKTTQIKKSMSLFKWKFIKKGEKGKSRSHFGATQAMIKRENVDKKIVLNLYGYGFFPIFFHKHYLLISIDKGMNILNLMHLKIENMDPTPLIYTLILTKFQQNVGFLWEINPSSLLMQLLTTLKSIVFC